MEKKPRGFNVGTPVQLDESLLGLVGFTQRQVETYVEDIFAEHQLDLSMKPTVLGDLKRLYDGYRFLPESFGDRPQKDCCFLSLCRAFI